MTPHAGGFDLAHSIAFKVLHDEQGYVGYRSSTGDVTAALLATGKTIIVECSRTNGAETSPHFAVERAVLEAHLDSPIPVYIAVARQTSSRRIHVDLCPARTLAERGGASPEAETMPVGPWHRFWQTQSLLAPSTAPPAHLASPVQLTSRELSDPQLAARLAPAGPDCDTDEPIPARHMVELPGVDNKLLPWVWQIPHPEREIFHYQWQQDGHRAVETAELRVRLDEHLRRVDQVRTLAGGRALVITRPWRTLRRLTEAELAALLVARRNSTAPRWASPVMESSENPIPPEADR